MDLFYSQTMFSYDWPFIFALGFKNRTLMYFYEKKITIELFIMHYQRIDKVN